MNNLVIDISNMFFRSMFIVSGFGKKGFTFENQDEISQLLRKLSTDITYIIRQTNPSRVVFAYDHPRSWRKSIEIEENEGYKGHRKKSKFIDWDNLFVALDEFGNILEDNGFIVSKIEKAEADDLMCLWKDEFLHKQKQHVILVSGDEDIRQLIDTTTHEDKTLFSTVYSPFSFGRGNKKHLYVNNQFNQWLREEDAGTIFDRSVDIDKEAFMHLRDTERIVVEEVVPKDIALKKIFCGDDGDNVPAIYSWLNDKGKKVRITNSKFKKIVKNLDINLWTDIKDKKDLIKQQIVKISKETDLPFDIGHRLDRQTKLVVLNSKVFPEEIINNFNSKVNKEVEKRLIEAQKYNMTSLLENTQHITKNSQGNVSRGSEASIFKDIDKISKELF